MSDISLVETAKHYMDDLESASHWLTEYAQDKAESQNLIDITVTINRARWLIGEYIGYYDTPIAEQTEPKDLRNVSQGLRNVSQAEQTEPKTCEACEHWGDTEDGCADRHGCKTEQKEV